MKKVALLTGVFGVFLLTFARAEFNANRDKVWRASFTQTAEAFVTITTHPAVFGGIIVGTSAAPSGQITLFNAQSFNNVLSTVGFAYLFSYAAQPAGTYQVDCSTGLSYTKTVAVPVIILWDYYFVPSRSVKR